MKKGIFLIVVGVVLIVLQILSIIGNSATNGSSLKPSLDFNFIMYLSGYLFVGIIGVIVLLFGIKACLHEKKEDVHTNKNADNSDDIEKE